VPVAANPTANQTVNFSFGPAVGNDFYKLTNKYEEWGITPNITWDINDNWQLRGMLNFGNSTASYQVPAINTTKLDQYASGTTAATALNVYNLGASPNMAAVNDILAWENAGDGKDKISNARVIVDGALFSLPGGKVRIAAGAEYLKDEYKNRYINFAVGTGGPIGAINNTPFTSYSRTVKSGFGELQVPIVGASNGMPGLRALDLSLAVRYDKYSDFGNTTNPKYGISYKPVDWVTLRGNWGKSFNAPTAVDMLGALTNTLSSQNFVPLAVPIGARPFVAGVDNTILFLGADPNLEPQTAKTYSIGLDVSPPVVPGLKFSVSYYNIDYKGFLGRAPFFTNATAFFQYYPKQGVLFPTAAQIQALIPQAAIVTPSIAALLAAMQAGTQRAYEIIDFRTFNLGNTKLSGLDLSIDYAHPTSFGSVDARISGNKQVTHYTQGSELAPFVDDLLYVPVFQLSASLMRRDLPSQAKENWQANLRLRFW
jgi:iron complex outermembrane receptor protein